MQAQVLGGKPSLRLRTVAAGEVVFLTRGQLFSDERYKLFPIVVASPSQFLNVGHSADCLV